MDKKYKEALDKAWEEVKGFGNFNYYCTQPNGLSTFFICYENEETAKKSLNVLTNIPVLFSIVKKQQENIEELTSEISRLLLAFQGQSSMLKVMAGMIQRLEIEKFKFNIDELLKKINDGIKGDEREAYQVKGTGLFESTVQQSDSFSEITQTITETMKSLERQIGGGLLGIISGSSETSQAVKDMLEQMKKVEGCAQKYVSTTQHFGIEVSVKNRRQM